MKVLSLFSGIGGLDLAAQWAGMETVAFCEIDDYACKVLERRFPGVPIYRDVRELTAERLKADGIENIDLITGGFPCQDVSCAGKRVGFHDSEGQITRSGLWAEYARIIGEIKPKWVVAENVRGLLSIPAVGTPGGGFGIVLRDLADMGYSAGWCCYGAADVGAYHRRERVFIVAHSNCFRRKSMEIYKLKRRSDLHIQCMEKQKTTTTNIYASIPWVFTCPSSGVHRVDDGISESMDRFRCLGNAVVPQQAYPIFKAIMDVSQCK